MKALRELIDGCARWPGGVSVRRTPHIIASDWSTWCASTAGARRDSGCTRRSQRSVCRPLEPTGCGTSPHVIRLLDRTRSYLHAVLDNFSRWILAWRSLSRLRQTSVAVCWSTPVGRPGVRNSDRVGGCRRARAWRISPQVLLFILDTYSEDRDAIISLTATEASSMEYVAQSRLAAIYAALNRLPSAATALRRGRVRATGILRGRAATPAGTGCAERLTDSERRARARRLRVHTAYECL